MVHSSINLLNDIVDENFSLKHIKGVFNATINNFHNYWRLQFTLNCIYSNNEWIISNADYKTF